MWGRTSKYLLFNFETVMHEGKNCEGPHQVKRGMVWLLVFLWKCTAFQEREVKVFGCFYFQTVHSLLSSRKEKWGFIAKGERCENILDFVFAVSCGITLFKLALEHFLCYYELVPFPMGIILWHFRMTPCGHCSKKLQLIWPNSLIRYWSVVERRSPLMFVPAFFWFQPWDYDFSIRLF